MRVLRFVSSAILAGAAAILAAAMLLPTAAMLILPALLAWLAFLAMLPLWLDGAAARDPRVGQALQLRMEPAGPAWSGSANALPQLQPYGPLIAAAIAAIAGVILEMVVLDQQFHDTRQHAAKDVASLGAVLAVFAAPWLPFVAAHRLPNPLHRLLARRLVTRTRSRFARETALLARIAELEQRIGDDYRALGITTREDATTRCRDALAGLAARPRANIRASLEEIAARLERDAEQLGHCADELRTAQAAFEDAKTAVIANGSTTLLDELDRIKLGLQSELLSSLLLDRKWDDAREILGLMAQELGNLRATAEGGARPTAAAADDGRPPETLDEAHRVLNVTKDTNKLVVKKLVDALRMSWHPDHVTDAAEKQKRTAKMQQINVAWDFIDGKRS